MKPDHTVVWNGRRDLDPYLFAEQHPAIRVESPYSRPLPDGTLTGRVRSVLKAQPDHWFTLPEIMQAAGLPQPQASSAVGNLVATGEAEREHANARGRVAARVQRYRWRS